jgi:hypothetical protein
MHAANVRLDNSGQSHPHELARTTRQSMPIVVAHLCTECTTCTVRLGIIRLMLVWQVLHEVMIIKQPGRPVLHSDLDVVKKPMRGHATARQHVQRRRHANYSG